MVSKDRQNFVACRSELMKPVRAFRDRVGYIPSIPTSATRPSHNIGYTNSLVEIAVQSLAFMQEFAREYTRLVAQIKLMGKTKELRSCRLDAVFATVAKGEEVPTPGTQLQWHGKLPHSLVPQDKQRLMRRHLRSYLNSRRTLRLLKNPMRF